jgi:hypothetical protein
MGTLVSQPKSTKLQIISIRIFTWIDLKVPIASYRWSSNVPMMVLDTLTRNRKKKSGTGAVLPFKKAEACQAFPWQNGLFLQTFTF